MIMVIITIELQLQSHYNNNYITILQLQLHYIAILYKWLGIILNNLIYLITFGLGHKSHLQQLWKILGLFPKTHYEEYHKNPEVAGQWEDLPREKGNDPYRIN